MNYYSFHIGDYRRDTTHLTLLEHGVYRQLMDWIYLDEKPIPKETDMVFRRLCARTDEEKSAVIVVLGELFELTESGYIQARCMGEISTYQGQATRARENGKLGGRPPKTAVVISGLLEETQTKANQEPITTKPLTTKPIEKHSAAFALPDWVNSAHWEMWVKSRKKMTHEQKLGQVDKLAAWRDAGLDFAGALQNAAINGTQGLFLPSQPKFSNQTKIPAPENFAQRNYGTEITSL